jgi:hypothetical protein
MRYLQSRKQIILSCAPAGRIFLPQQTLIMDAIAQVFQEAFLPVNLLFTGFLGISILYWLMVIFGCLGSEDVDAGQADIHTDLQTDLQTDLHTDLQTDVDTDADMQVEADGAETQLHPVQGMFHAAQPVLRFLHLGDVPIVPLLSLMALFLWIFALLGNHHYNPQHRWDLAALLLIPNLVVTCVLVHYLAYPVKKLFQAMNHDADAPKPIIGSLCKVITMQATPEFGEAIIDSKGAPLQIHVRTAGGQVLQQGDQAIVISENKDQGTFNVTGLKELQHQLKKQTL